MENVDMLLWAVGVLISIALAFVAGKWVINRSSQNAKASKGSTIIQSGRDTKLK